MVSTGIADYKSRLKRLARTLNVFGQAEVAAFQSPETQELEEDLILASEIIKESRQLGDPFVCIEMEKYCVNFERAFFATTAQEQKRYDKQLSELQSAKFSAQLVFEPERYRQHVEDAYGPNRKIMFPPAGETCVTALQKQIQQLARPKVGIVSPTIKEFYSVRQQNLRCALGLCIEAQCKALDIPVPKQGKSKGLEL